MSVATKQKDLKPEPVAYSEAALRNNAAVVEYCRTSMAALSGSTAGVLGLTGLYGFIFYVFAVIILWIKFMAKTGSNWHKYMCLNRVCSQTAFSVHSSLMYCFGHSFSVWFMYIRLQFFYVKSLFVFMDQIGSDRTHNTNFVTQLWHCFEEFSIVSE